MACWDIFGKAVNLPVSALLGGTRNPEYPLYRAISMGTETAMADEVLEYKSEGYHRFQLKVGGDPAEDIRRIRAVAEVIDSSDILVADANTGWTTHEALRTARATEDLDIYIEQPCATWGEVAAIRKQIRQPLILCELITDVHAILEVAHSRVADVVNLKVSRLGGLTRTAQARDLCERLGLPMTIEDGMGGDIVTAAVSQLAASTRPGYLFSTTHMNLYGSIPIAKGVPQAVNGRTRVSVLPGLGIDVDEQLLGRPMLSYRE
jgi:L-alanine-DL-glutamate epimerase-like enolase superfamily enzyme